VPTSRFPPCNSEQSTFSRIPVISAPRYLPTSCGGDGTFAISNWMSSLSLSTEFDVLCIESSQLTSTAAWQHLRDSLRQEKGVLLILNEAPHW
jgi:hypothetical protein